MPGFHDHHKDLQVGLFHFGPTSSRLPLRLGPTDNLLSCIQDRELEFLASELNMHLIIE